MEGLTANSVSSDLKPSAAQIPSLTKKSPQDWRAYIDTMKLKVQAWDDHRRYRTISYLYVNAFKLIPDADLSSLSHAQLLVDFAEFTSHYDPNEAVRILVCGRKTLSRYSIIYVASAELELKRGQREEAVNILQKAISLKTEPVSDIMRALEMLNEGKTELRDHAERTQDDTDCGVLMDISNKPELSTVRNVKADALTSMSAAASQNASFPADVPNTRERYDVLTTPACKLPKVVDKMIIGDSCQRSDSSQKSDSCQRSDSSQKSNSCQRSDSSQKSDSCQRRDSSQKSDSCQRSEIPSVLIVEPPLHQGPTRKLQLPSLDKTRLTTEISGPITQQSNGTWPVYSSTPLSLRSGDRTGDRLEVRAESTRECVMKQHEVQQPGGVSRRSLSTYDYGSAVNSAITPAKSLLMQSNSFTGDSVTPGVSLELDSKRVIQNGGRDSTGEISSSQLSGSLTFRKFRPLNLGPPRRVKVNPALKKLSDDEDDELQSQRSTFSDPEPHSQPAAGSLGQAELQLASSSTNTAEQVQADTHSDILRDKSHQRLGAGLFTGTKPEILPTPKKTDSGVVWERTCQRSGVKLFPAAKTDTLTYLFAAGSVSRAAAAAGSGFPLVAHKCHSNSTSSHPSCEAPRVADKTIIEDSLRKDISEVLMVKPVSCQGPSRKLQLPSSDYSNRPTAEVSRPIAQFSNGAYPSTPVGIRPDEHQKVESTKEILITQQELIQQILQQQQQQQHQQSTANINPSGEAPRVADKTIIGDSLRNDISAVLMVKPVSCQGPSRKLQLPSSDCSNRPTAEVSRPIAQFSNGAYPSTPVGIRPDEHQKVKSSKEILIKKQQELIQQLLQQQQQQQQQSMANNRTFPAGDSQLAVPSGITPAKSLIQSEHKTIVVNGKPYTVMNLVGRGGSAKVYRVYDAATNTILAVKCVNLACANQIIVEGYKNEINLLKKLQHCGRVIKLYDYEYVEASKKLYVVLEYGETDLCKFISQNEKSQTLHPINISYFWFQMVSAVHAMHKEGVIHSDLKPANFILVSGEVKLIDFGIANSLQQDSTSVLKENMVGTPSYMSPEALMSVGPYTDDSKPTYKIGVRSDVWSLGCILYQMVYGHTPFQHVRQKLEAIVNPAHQIPFPDKGDPKLMDILKKCLTRNISERPTTSELLNHPYLQK